MHELGNLLIVNLVNNVLHVFTLGEKLLGPL